MSDRAALIYLYDESFDGLLCCIFESYTKNEIPTDILPVDTKQLSLFDTKTIETDTQNAKRVYTSLKKHGRDSEMLIKAAFLYGYPEKAIAIFQYIRLLFKVGSKAYNMLQNEASADLHDMERAVTNERHHMVEFLRFAEYHGGLIAVIEPKHAVLPLMKQHFSSRFPEEHFIIFDKTHKTAMFYQPYEVKIAEVEDIELPDASLDEAQFQSLWHGYFRAIAIKERENARCQMGLMPKRFRKNMLETQAETPTMRAVRENMPITIVPPAVLPHLESERTVKTTSPISLASQLPG